MRRLFSLLALVGLIPLLGCQSEPTADQAIQAMSTNLTNNKPHVAYDGLPESYQKDVDDLVHEFAGKMDAEIWNGGFGVAKKVVKILQEKKDFILANPQLQSMSQTIDMAEASKNWDTVVKAVSILVNSDISELERLKTLKVESFLATTGSEFMTHVSALAAVSKQDEFNEKMQKLKAAKYTLVSSEGEDKAKVKVEIQGEDPNELDMVKVEGKWIPQELADEWPAMIKQAKEGLAQIDQQQIQEAKPMVMAQIKMIDSQLNLLLDTKTEEEFNNKLIGMVGAIMMSAGGPPAGAFGAPTGDDLEMDNGALELDGNDGGAATDEPPGVEVEAEIGNGGEAAPADTE